MKLIVGLGNPGRAYARHRHNIGFLVIDLLAKRLNVSVAKKLFRAKICSATIGSEHVVLAKPQTFMNLSGISVAPLLGYHKCTFKDLIVIHDDLDLDLGRIKFGFGSGHGGHNGIKSVIDELGTQDFYRVRVGIGRPQEGVDPADYVLHPFLKDELKFAKQAVAKAADAIPDLITRGLSFVQQKYH